MVALKKVPRVEPAMDRGRLEERLKLGERRLLEANKAESAGFVLLGLEGRPGLEPWMETAQRLSEADRTPPLTRAWLRLGLRLHGQKLEPSETPATNDLMLLALEALADEEGNHGLLRSADQGAAI
jgi:hypothetical protein